MSDYIPDPIELAEAKASHAFNELEQPGGKFKCYQCEALFDPSDEGGTLSPDPYAMPVCGVCFESELTAWAERNGSPL